MASYLSLLYFFIFSNFQVYLAASSICKLNIYVFSIPFKNSYGCIDIFGDTYIVDDYIKCKPYDPRLFLEFI